MFLVGAFVVLYSTVFIATASNGRLLADSLSLFRLIRPKDQQQHDRLIRISCVALPLTYLLLFLVMEKPLTLVMIGALAQALMLPLLCVSALFFHHSRVDPHLRSKPLWTICLWGASLAMICAGGYQMINEVPKAWQTLRSGAAAEKDPGDGAEAAAERSPSGQPDVSTSDSDAVAK